MAIKILNKEINYIGYNYVGYNKRQMKRMLVQRLKKDKWKEQYRQLVASQKNNPFDLYIGTDENHRLIGFLTGPIFREPIDYFEENKFRAYLNLSPIKFLRRLCAKADQSLKFERNSY